MLYVCIKYKYLYIKCNNMIHEWDDLMTQNDTPSALHGSESKAQIGSVLAR